VVAAGVVDEVVAAGVVGGNVQFNLSVLAGNETAF